STDSAYLAAELGLPYAFASHFAPAQFHRAIAIYRQHFKPSDVLSEPYVLACVNVIAADTDDEAHVLATSMYQMFLGIVTNSRRPLQPPVPSMEPYWSPEIEQAVRQMTACTFIGGPESLSRQLATFVDETDVDELMTTGNIYDQGARLKSYRILSEVIKKN